MSGNNAHDEFIKKLREFNGQRELKPGEDYFPQNNKIINIKDHL